MIPSAGPMESGFSLSAPWPPSDHSVEPGTETQLAQPVFRGFGTELYARVQPRDLHRGQGLCLSSVSTHSCTDFRVHACLKSGAL